MGLTKERRAEIRARLETTTPGEWQPEPNRPPATHIYREGQACAIGSFEFEGDAEFATAAHNTDIPDLLDALDASETTLAAYRDALEAFHCCEKCEDREYFVDREGTDADMCRIRLAAHDLLASPDPGQGVAERLKLGQAVADAAEVFADWLTATLADARATREKQMAEVEAVQRPLMELQCGKGWGDLWAVRAPVTDAFTHMLIYGFELVSKAASGLTKAKVAYDKAVGRDG